MSGTIGWAVGRREGVVEPLPGLHPRSPPALKNLLTEELHLFVPGGDREVLQRGRAAIKGGSRQCWAHGG